MVVGSSAERMGSLWKAATSLPGDIIAAWSAFAQSSLRRNQLRYTPLTFAGDGLDLLPSLEGGVTTGRQLLLESVLQLLCGNPCILQHGQ